MGIMKLVSVIFEFGVTQLCSYNQGDFVELEDNKSPAISIFGISEYYTRSEIERIVALWNQAYYVTWLPKDFQIIYPQVINTSEGYKDSFIDQYHYENDSYAESNLKEGNPD